MPKTSFGRRSNQQIEAAATQLDRLTNPEQLFAAGWSACFLSALRSAAGHIKVPLPASTAIDAEVDLTQVDGIYGLAVRFRISIPGMEREVAQNLIRTAHETCPYSRATRGNIVIELS